MQTTSLAVMTPLLLTNFKLDYATVALVITVNNLTSYALQPFFGLASDRRSLPWLLPLGCLLSAGGMVTVLFMPSYWLVLLAVIVSGLGAAAYHPEGSRNANWVSGSQKATGMSFFFFSGNLGQAFGPITLTLLLALFGTGGAVFMLLPGLLAATLLWRLMPLYTRQASQRKAAPRLETAPSSRSSKVRLLAILLSIISLRSMIQVGLITFIPLYFISQSAANRDYAAFLLSVFVFAAAIGTLIGGPLADRLGHKTVMVCSLSLVMPLLLIFLNSTGPLQVATLALAGTSLVSASSLTVVMAQEILPNNIGLATGLTLGLGFGAGGIGAAGLGRYADAFGLSQTMFVLTLLPIPVVLLSFFISYKPRPVQANPTPTEAEVKTKLPEGVTNRL